MKTRIEAYFEDNKDRKTLVTYISGGDYSLDFSYDLILEMERVGVDIVEIGIPYSDPLADGEVIQRASQRALDKKVNLDHIFDLLKKLRQVSQIPLVFLVYYNVVYSYGLDRFIEKSQELGLDGLIIPDLPLEERRELIDKLRGRPLDLIPLVAPTSRDRIGPIVRDSSGFIYCVSSKGVTGARSSLDSGLEGFMKEVRRETDLPLLIGFGVSSAAMARDISKYSDGVIVGSALIERLEDGIEDGSSLLRVSEFCQALRRGLDY